MAVSRPTLTKIRDEVMPLAEACTKPDTHRVVRYDAGKSMRGIRALKALVAPRKIIASSQLRCSLQVISDAGASCCVGRGAGAVSRWCSAVIDTHGPEIFSRSEKKHHPNKSVRGRCVAGVKRICAQAPINQNGARWRGACRFILAMSRHPVSV